MKNSLVFNYLRTFTDEELKEFSLYLNNLHARKTVLLKIFTYIKKFHPTYEDEWLDKEIAYRKIFKSKEFNYRRLMDSLSDLHKIAWDFLLQKKLKEESFLKDQLMMQILDERNLGELYLKQIEEAQERTEKRKDKIGVDIYYFLQKLLLSHSSYFSPHALKMTEETSIPAAMDNLDLFYTATKLKYSTEMIIRQGVVNEQNEVYLLDQIVKDFDKKILEPTEFHLVYLFLIKLFKKQGGAKDVVAFIEAQIKVLPKIELKNVLLHIINYLSILIRQGKSDYGKIALQVYQTGIDREILLDVNNEISSNRFLNIIDLACKLESQDWLELFIKNYKKFIPVEERKDTSAVSQATIYNAYGNCKAALKLVEKRKCPNILINIRAKQVVLCCYYELQKDELWNYLRSFDVYMKRNELLSPKIILSFVNLIKYTKKLAERKMPVDELRCEIEQEQLITAKLWLLEMLRSYHPL